MTTCSNCASAPIRPFPLALTVPQTYTILFVLHSMAKVPLGELSQGLIVFDDTQKPLGF